MAQYLPPWLGSSWKITQESIDKANKEVDEKWEAYHKRKEEEKKKGPRFTVVVVVKYPF